MAAKYVRICALLIGLVFLALPVYADVVGTWDATGTMSHKISIKKAKLNHSSGTEPITDTFIFDSNNNFTATSQALTGTWAYGNGKQTKVVVSIPEDQLATFLTTETEQTLADAGYPGATVDNVVITKNSFIAKEMRDGTVVGKWKLNFTCNITYSIYMRFAKVKTTTTATATKETVSASPASGEGIMGVLAEELSGQIQEALMAIESKQ
jgi:hypothetical protein